MLATIDRWVSSLLAPSPTSNYWYGPVGRKTSAGVPVDDNASLNYSAVWLARRIVSETAARLPLFLYRKIEANGGKVVVSTHQLFPQLHRMPNHSMTSFTYRTLMTDRMVNWGNAFAEIERDGAGRVLAQWPIHPSRIPKRNITINERGERIYHVQSKGATTIPIHQDNMLHLPGAHPDEDGYGKGVIAYAAESIGMGLATEKHGATFFGNGARPGGVLETDKVLKLEALKGLRKHWNEVHQSPPNAHNIAILEAGMKYHALDIPPEQAQFLETRQHNISEIARWYMLPPHKLADLRSATFNNMEQLGQEFLDSIVPWLVIWEQNIWASLLTKSERDAGYFAEHVMNALLRADAAARAAFYASMLGNGVFTINDVLRLENMNPIDPAIGDVRFISTNLQTVANAIAAVPQDKANSDMAAKLMAALSGVSSDVRQIAERRDTQALQSVAAIADAITSATDARQQVIELTTRTDDEDNRHAALLEAIATLRTSVDQRITELQSERDARHAMLVGVARNMLAGQVARMSRIEGQAAIHAAEQPAKFLKWLDTFYDKQQATFFENIRPAVDALAALGEVIDVPALAREHLGRHREDLLNASDGEPSSFAGRVAETVGLWEAVR